MAVLWFLINVILVWWGKCMYIGDANSINCNNDNDNDISSRLYRGKYTLIVM